MKKLITLLVFAVICSPSLRAQRYDSSFHFYYYDAKLTMFEIMPDQDDEVVWLGDSITDNCEWGELFPQQKNLNRGISNDITFGVLYRIHEVTRRKPKKVFILIGINDIARGIPDAVILKNYGRIIDSIQLHSPATRICFQSVLPTNNSFRDFPGYYNKDQHVRSVNAELKKLCEQKKIIFVDLYSEFLDKEGKLDRRYTIDGVHLTGEGFKNWKRVLLKNKLI